MHIILIAALSFAPVGDRCAATGFSRDQTREGLPVRAEPSTDAPEVGRVYTNIGERTPEDPDPKWSGPGFRITDMQGDWVKIDGADPYSGDTPRNYSGPGWVPLASVGLGLTDKRMTPQSFSSYAAPSFGSRVIDPHGVDNALFDPDEPVLLACRGPWVRLRYRRHLYLDEAAPPEGWIEGWFKSSAFYTPRLRE